MVPIVEDSFAFLENTVELEELRCVWKSIYFLTPTKISLTHKGKLMGKMIVGTQFASPLLPTFSRNDQWN